MIIKKITNKNITCTEPIKVIYLFDFEFKQAVRYLNTKVFINTNKHLKKWKNDNVMLKNNNSTEIFNLKLIDIIEYNTYLELIFEHI